MSICHLSILFSWCFVGQNHARRRSGFFDYHVGDYEAHRAEAGLQQRVPRLPSSVCQYVGADDGVKMKAFLQFTTGCSSLSPGGFGDGSFPLVNTFVHYLEEQVAVGALKCFASLADQFVHKLQPFVTF